MYLFATAGGGGEAYDACFFCPAFVVVLAAALTALIGLVNGSARASIVAVVMAGTIGALVLLAVATHTPSDDPDEQGSEQMYRLLLWGSVTGASFSLISAIVVAAGRRALTRYVNGASPDPGAAADWPRD